MESKRVFFVAQMLDKQIDFCEAQVGIETIISNKQVPNEYEYLETKRIQTENPSKMTSNIMASSFRIAPPNFMANQPTPAPDVPPQKLRPI